MCFCSICFRAPVLPLECYHGNSYSDSVEAVRSDTGRIEGLHLRFLMDGQHYTQYITVCVVSYTVVYRASSEWDK